MEITGILLQWLLNFLMKTAVAVVKNQKKSKTESTLVFHLSYTIFETLILQICK